MSDEDAESKPNPPAVDEGLLKSDQHQYIAGYELGLTNYSFGDSAAGQNPTSTAPGDAPPSAGLADAEPEPEINLKTTQGQSGTSELMQSEALREGHVRAAGTAPRALSMHTDLSELSDILFGQGASILVLVGSIIIFIGVQSTSTDAPSAVIVAAMFGVPIFLMGIMGYLKDQFWRKRSSWVFASQKPAVQRVKIFKRWRSHQTYYEISVPSLNELEPPDEVIVVKSSQAIELLPAEADASVYRDPVYAKVLLVVLDSDIDSGWRLWCGEKALLGPGKQQDFFWVPRLLVAYFLVAAIMLFMIRSQNNGISEQARSWPTTPGKITQVQRQHRSEYCHYSYTVAGKEYDSDRISMYSRSTFRRYSPGEDVVVHYDPKHPELAVLNFDGDWYSLGWALTMGVLAFFFFLVGQASDFKQKGEK